MVIFQTPDGSPGYNQFESVDEAVSFVEKLRNEQGIENARMFALEEIKFELKPYFKVELQALNPGTSSTAPLPASPAATPSAPTTPPSPGAPSTAAPAPSSEPTSFGTAAPSPLSEPTPTPSPEPAPATTPPTQAEAPSSEQPTRRGLFGR
jgi:predicted component of type VI protein secretion system